MKKMIAFAIAGLLISGASFAGGGKKCGGKDCCKDKKETTSKVTKASKAKEVKKA